MNLRRISAVTLRQFFLLSGNKIRVVNIFYWILLDLVLWGFITRYLDMAGKASFSFFTVVLGAVVLWNFMIRIIQGMTMAFLEDVWARNFLNLFASPITVAEYITGIMVTSFTTSMMALVVMTGFVWVAFGYSMFMLGLSALPFLFILLLFGLAIGTFVTAVVLRLGPSGEWLAWPIPFLLGPFSGVFYPISSLPKLIQPIAAALPSSYVFENMRSLLISGTISLPQLCIALALALGYLGLAYLFLLKVYRHVLVNGLLTRFTAETA